MHRQLAGRHFATDQRTDQHLLRALGVLDAERVHPDVEVVRQGAPDGVDCVGLVLLDPDHGSIDTEAAHHDASAEVDAFRVFHHAAVIGGKVRLTLAAVDHQHVDCVLFWRRELDVRGKCGAPETDHPGTTNGFDQLLWREVFPLRNDPRAECLRRVRCDGDPNRLGKGAVRVGPELHPGDGARRRGVHRRRHPAVGLGNQVAALDPVPRLHQRDRRLAGVLPQRQHDLVGEGHAPDRVRRGQLLQLRRVHAVAETESRQHPILS